MSTESSILPLEEIIVSDFEEFVLNILKEGPCSHWKYRGVEDSKFLLIPSIGRRHDYIRSSKEDREEIERSFLRRSWDSSRFVNTTELQSMISAQHHGAPTRLLDWSESPLVAAYFACPPKCTPDGSGNLRTPVSDAAIYAIHCCSLNNSDSIAYDLSEIDQYSELLGTIGFKPPNATARVAAQHSFFTISPDPTTSLELQQSALITNIRKYVIPINVIDKFQNGLFKLGIRTSSIFPDIDGVNSSLAHDSALEETAASLCNIPK